MSTTAPTSAAAKQGTTIPVLAVTGKNTIADGVVAKVAGIAAREVAGVFDLGNGAVRALGAIRNAVGQQDRAQGVSVEVGETQVAADITVVAEYPVDLQALADNVRASVSDAIESVVGMQVADINVTISDVHIPSDDNDDEAAESRVL